ncbi:ATP-grasp domain-containing protein [Bacteriovoracaceae bacterium]|nr:ATP-grasp domain-containing protein [Bacteriovoracaceae bacterium]
MRQLRVLVLMHVDLVPPEDASEQLKVILKEKKADPIWLTELNVIETLHEIGHDVKTLGVYSDLIPIRQAVEEFKPHVVFNLLEEFDGEALFDQNVVSYLELLRVAYTGNNPRSLILGRDKALTKKILTFHRIKTPKFVVFPKNKKKKVPKWITYPVIVKCLNEEASLGISQASVVKTEDKLLERVAYINKTFNTDAIAEEFIEGREFYVGVYGNYRLHSLPVWELVFKNVENPEKELYSRQAKWNDKYRSRKGISTENAKLDDDLVKQAQKLAKKTYKALELNGYARIDLRMNDKNELYVIEANPNPNIGIDDEFALSAQAQNMKYPELIQKIVSLALNWFDGT